MVAYSRCNQDYETRKAEATEVTNPARPAPHLPLLVQQQPPHRRRCSAGLAARRHMPRCLTALSYATGVHLTGMQAFDAAVR